MSNIKIYKKEWMKHVIIPDEFKKVRAWISRIEDSMFVTTETYRCEQTFIDKLESSMQIEGYCDIYGSLDFNDKNNISEFLTSYETFFKEDFLDLLIDKAVELTKQNQALQKNIDDFTFQMNKLLFTVLDDDIVESMKKAIEEKTMEVDYIIRGENHWKL